MRKLGRIVRRVLTAVSLLLFVAVLAAWVRGYWHDEAYWVSRESMDAEAFRHVMWRVEWRSGWISMLCGRDYADAAQAKSAGISPGVRWRDEFLRPRTGLFGPFFHPRLEWRTEEIRDGMSLKAVHLNVYTRVDRLAFPCWMAAIVFGALPSWRCFVWWRGVRRRRRASLAGRCGVCGYDLRASPERCPECGTAVGGKGE